MQGKVEVIWQGTLVPASLKALGAECHVTGDTVRAVIDENQQDAVIDALRRERLRLIALTPLRTSLQGLLRRKTATCRNLGWEDGMRARVAHVASTRFGKRCAIGCSIT